MVLQVSHLEYAGLLADEQVLEKLCLLEHVLQPPARVISNSPVPLLFR
jgi:hypothetical protein